MVERLKNIKKMSNFTEFIISKSIEKIALIDDQRSISYNELAVSIRQHVSYLKSIGIRSGDKIVIALPDSIEWCISFLSCIYMGGVAIIVSSKTPIEEIYSIEANKFFTSIDQIQQINYVEDEPYEWSESEIGFYLTTSGTSGYQRFVLHNHSTLFKYLDIITQPYDIDETSVLFSSPRLSFSYGLGICIVLGLGVGATIVLTDKILSNRVLDNKIGQYHISHFFSTPVFLNSLVKYNKNLDNIKKLKVVICGGETLSNYLKDKFYELHQQRILNIYGLTEAFSCVSAQTIYDEPSIDSRIIGKPLKGVEIKTINGELYVKHPCAAVGYLNENSEVFKDGWVKTNDIVEINDKKELIYISRKGNLVKVKSQMVSIDEIEHHIIKYPNVQECVVYTKINSKGLTELRANLKVKNQIDTNDLRKFLIKKIELYKIPKKFIIVTKIPKTYTNKKIRITSLQLE